MHYYDNILGLIGRTPLVKLNRMNRGIKATVLAKMENLNPGFSVKDRIGVAMIAAAEREGKLKPGGTIVEATSGNTGIGLALAAAVKGYKCIFVMTDKASAEKSRYLKALGADVVITPVSAKPGTPDHYVTTAQRIASETPNSFYPDQYSHPANPEAHYHTTGPEIWEQTEGKITHFVAGIGTGGTISGTGRFLKEKNPKIRVVGADPFGSIFKTYKETGKVIETTPYLVEGIGQEVVPPNVHIKYIDEVINVTDGESFEMSRQLGRTEGIFVADQAELTWLPRYLVSVAPPDRLSEALAKMNELGLTQIPVLEEGRPVGSLRENRVLAKVVRNRHLLDSPVSEVMEATFPTVDVDASAHEVTRRLQTSPAVLVEEYGRIIGIITRHDVLDLKLGNTGSLV